MRRLIPAFLLLIIYHFSYAQETFPVNGTADKRHTTFAFVNARIYTDYKTYIDSAVLIVRDDRIVSVGRNASIPEGAVLFNLAGKFIYPSFIDIFSDYGLPEVKKTPDDGTPQFLSSKKGAYNWNEAIRAEYNAAGEFTADAKKAEELRKYGFGMVMTHRHDGIVRGTGAVVMPGDGKENDLVVEAKGAACYSFDKGTSNQDYPSSLMGAIALLRQSYLDAQWYAAGGYREEFNHTLQSMGENLKLPQVFEVNEKQDALRAARIGEEFGLKYIIKGNGDEYERLDEIKATGLSYILPLNFPEPFDLSDPYDAINISLREMKQWELAPLNPSMVSKAGIPFALTAAGLKNMSDFQKNLRKAIDAGLSTEDALKALTHTPATMLKIDDRTGRLAPALLANFIITSGPIFEKETVIFENWISGKRYQFLDTERGDIRGNYTLQIPGIKPLRMLIGGNAIKPEVTIYEDTQATKITFSRQGPVINFQIELKKTEPKGIYRLTGISDERGNDTLSGNVFGPDGEWKKWTARFDSAYTPAKPDADSIRREIEAKGDVLYPNMAYGRAKLPEQRPFVVRNATVWTNEADGILTEADVYVVNGKIEAVGKDLTVPGGITEVDGTNRHLTSGIIDEHSHIAISGSVNEATQASSAEVRIADVIDADDIQIYRQLAGGVTVSHILHGSANPIGGQSQLIKLRWGQSPEKLKFEDWPGFIKFALGENVKQSHWGDKQVVRFPQTRQGVEQVYMDYFTQAREYSARMKAFNALPAKTRSLSKPVRRSLELDALVEILDAKRFITCHSYVQSEINMLMHVADTFGFTINTFTHILEGYKLADKMKDHGVLGASTFADWWAYKFEVYEAIPYNGALMHRMGLNVSFNSDDAEMARRLNQEAAKAVLYGGVSEEDAWKFVTLNPAKMLRIDHRVGSIRKGKDADLVLWNEHPLSIYAKPLQTYVDGVKYFDIDEDERMRKEIAAERNRLMQKMTEAKNKGEATKKPSVKMTEIKHCDGSHYHFID